MSAPRRQLAVAAGLVLASLCEASLGGSQLFKCVEGGRTVYQQQACSVSSQPELAASAPRPQAKASAPAAAAAPALETVAATRRLKPPSPASAAIATSR
jgi:hypothetical protein